MDKKIKVLHIVGSMHPGGMENFIMNIYEKIDKEKFEFGFAVHALRDSGYEERIKALGGKVFLLPRMTRKPLANYREIKRIVKEEGYDIVVRHTPNALVAPQLRAAKKAGAVTVCHSHNTTDPQKIAHALGKIMLKKAADIKLACSEDAGEWMYGNQKFEVVNNAIDLEKFSYNHEYADEIRKEFKFEDRHIYGHIANFLPSKNHTFLVDIFNELLKLDDKAVLICLGGGALKEEIAEKIKSLKLEDRIILAGIRNDAYKFMSAFELMIFPSNFEGLPLTLIEAQASGLPILMSDTITDNVIVTDGLVTKMSLDEGALVWAKSAAKRRNKAMNDSRECQRDTIKSFGYDLDGLVEWYEKFLLRAVNK